MIRYTCPHCGKTHTAQHRSDVPHRPFCCKRCQLIDLGKWLDGEYVISDPLLPDQDVPDSEAPPRTDSVDEAQ